MSLSIPESGVWWFTLYVFYLKLKLNRIFTKLLSKIKICILKNNFEILYEYKISMKDIGNISDVKFNIWLIGLKIRTAPIIWLLVFP